MQNSNEKSKECNCCGTLGWIHPCTCLCHSHKPSVVGSTLSPHSNEVEVSRCCGAEKGYHPSQPLKENKIVCSICDKPFEPQSIPLDRCVDTTCSRNHNHLGVHWEEYYNPTPNFIPESEHKRPCDMKQFGFCLDFGVNCPNYTPESTEMEEWDEFIRDVCSVVPKSKSEVRRRLNNLLSSHSKKLVSEYKKELIEKCVDRQKWYSGDANEPIRDGIDDIINIIKQ